MPTTIWERPFTVLSSDNNLLACLATAPEHPPTGCDVPPAGTAVTILCHGYTASKRHPLITSLCTGIVAEGRTVVRFDFSGNGGSTGEFRYSNYAQEAEDLRAVIQQLRENYAWRVDTIVGHSKGASVVLLYGAKYNDVPNIVNLAGRWRMERGMDALFGEEAMKRMEAGSPYTMRTRRVDWDGSKVALEYQMTIEQVRGRAAIDMAAAVAALHDGTHVLTIHGDQDSVIPVQDGRDLHAAVKEGELIVLEGAGHGFDGFEQQVVDAILRFCSAAGTGEEQS